METVLQFLLDVAIVVGPTAGYVDQYFSMRKAGAVDGFSPHIPLILLTSNILRVFFWIAQNPEDRFDTALLCQSLLMITLMMTFLELMTRLRPAQLTTPRQPLSIMKTFQPKLFLPNFWRWPDFASYAIFLLVFSFSIGLVVWIFRGVHIVSEGIGLVALLIEATLPLPQLFQIIKTKSVHGFSSILMLVWLFGDSFKLFYFLYKVQPMQFILCSVVQISADLAILFCWFRFSGNRYSSIDKESSVSDLSPEETFNHKAPALERVPGVFSRTSPKSDLHPTLDLPSNLYFKAMAVATYASIFSSTATRNIGSSPPSDTPRINCNNSACNPSQR